MTPLEKFMRGIIGAEGPMPIDRYMALCLGHPQHGYYMTRDPFGEEGDFITAPEISQIFGELIGIWCATQWDALGRPESFYLVELGPGRGTLMADVLKSGKVAAGFSEAAGVHLVETSPVLRGVQAERLGQGVTWHDSLNTVPLGPMLLIANEFFDAIPIRQFERKHGKWMERCVGLEGIELQPTSFSFSGNDGDIVEFSPQRAEIASEIADRLRDDPGAALIIDYGHLKSAPGDTLQAVRAHQYVSFTDEPGNSDITSHVNFEALERALRKNGAVVHAPLTQRAFLKNMGIAARAAILSSKADAMSRGVLERGISRLTAREGMGDLFKVLAATSPGLPTPYPFGGT